MSASSIPTIKIERKDEEEKDPSVMSDSSVRTAGQGPAESALWRSLTLRLYDAEVRAAMVNVILRQHSRCDWGALYGKYSKDELGETLEVYRKAWKKCEAHINAALRDSIQPDEANDKYQAMVELGFSLQDMDVLKSRLKEELRLHQERVSRQGEDGGMRGSYVGGRPGGGRGAPRQAVQRSPTHGQHGDPYPRTRSAQWLLHPQQSFVGIPSAYDASRLSDTHPRQEIGGSIQAPTRSNALYTPEGNPAGFGCLLQHPTQPPGSWQVAGNQQGLVQSSLGSRNSLFTPAQARGIAGAPSQGGLDYGPPSVPSQSSNPHHHSLPIIFVPRSPPYSMGGRGRGSMLGQSGSLLPSVGSVGQISGETDASCPSCRTQHEPPLDSLAGSFDQRRTHGGSVPSNHDSSGGGTM